MKKKYHFYLESKKRIIEFLNKYEVPYETHTTISLNDRMEKVTEDMCVFDLYGDDDTYRKFKWQFPNYASEGIRSIEYSEKEIEESEWLFVYNKSNKVQWVYDEESFRETCRVKIPIIGSHYRHAEQVKCLSATKAVKWGTRQFFSGPNAMDDIIFCSDKARKMLQDKWNGLEFWTVKKYNTCQNIEDLYQLVFNEKLPIEAISGWKKGTCSICGRKIIRIPKGEEQISINRKYLKDLNSVYSTGEVLTGDVLGCNTFSLNIVPQSFYQYCKQYGMNRGMVYIPINLL